MAEALRANSFGLSSFGLVLPQYFSASFQRVSLVAASAIVLGEKGELFEDSRQIIRSAIISKIEKP